MQDRTPGTVEYNIGLGARRAYWWYQRQLWDDLPGSETVIKHSIRAQRPIAKAGRVVALNHAPLLAVTSPLDAIARTKLAAHAEEGGRDEGLNDNARGVAGPPPASRHRHTMSESSQVASGRVVAHDHPSTAGDEMASHPGTPAPDDASDGSSARLKTHRSAKSVRSTSSLELRVDSAASTASPTALSGALASAAATAADDATTPDEKHLLVAGPAKLVAPPSGAIKQPATCVVCSLFDTTHVVRVVHECWAVNCSL